MLVFRARRLLQGPPKIKLLLEAPATVEIIAQINYIIMQMGTVSLKMNQHGSKHNIIGSDMQI